MGMGFETNGLKLQCFQFVFQFTLICTVVALLEKMSHFQKVTVSDKNRFLLSLQRVIDDFGEMLLQITFNITK